MYSYKRIKGKGSTQGCVARTGCCEERRKGAYRDFNLDDFSRNGSQRGMLKIPKKGSRNATFFLCRFYQTFVALIDV
jgi:hypothetical protein